MVQDVTVGSTGKFNSQLETISCHDACGHNGDYDCEEIVHFVLLCSLHAV